MRKLTLFGKLSTKVTAMALAFVMCLPTPIMANDIGDIDYGEGNGVLTYDELLQNVLDEAKELGVPNAFMRHYFASDFEEDAMGSYTTELIEGESEQPEIKVKHVLTSANADGVEIKKVNVAVLARTKFDLGEFDFRYFKTGRIVYNMLASAKLKGTAYLYAGDQEEPFTEFKIKRTANEDWEATKNLSADARNLNLGGETKAHIYLKFVADSALKDDGSINNKAKDKGSIYLESLFFTEGSTPVLEFDLDEEVNTIETINGSPDHSIMGIGTMNIKVPEGYTTVTDEPMEDESYDLEYIRGRGNSTWLVDKKPYKVKLDKAADLFGMGKNKHWVLLANYYDYSLIRNQYTFYLAEELGLEYTPKSVAVDVVISGEYCGSYQFSQQVRVGDTRVEIDDLEDKPQTEEPGITGGYLLSMGSSWLTENDEDLEYIKTTSNSFRLESPEYDDDYPEAAKAAQLKYINTFMGELELLVNSLDPDYVPGEGENELSQYMDSEGNIDYEAMLADLKLAYGDLFEEFFGKDYGVTELKAAIEQQMADSSEYEITLPEGKTWRDYMDERSFIDYYLLQEFSLNGDSYVSSSTYLYKKREGLLYWGPVWDFDFVAWAAYATNYTAGGGAEGFQMASRTPWLMNLLKYDEEFKNNLLDRWEVFSTILKKSAAEGGYLDQLADKTYMSALANYQVRSSYLMDGMDYWEKAPTLKLVDNDGNPYTLNYRNEINRLKEFINTRAAWIDENIENIDEYADPFGEIPPIQFFVDDSLYFEAEVDPEDGSYEWPEDPEKEGLVFKGWYYINEDGEEVKLNEGNLPALFDFYSGQVTMFPVYAKFVEPSEIVSIQSLAFAQDTLYVPIYKEYYYDSYIGEEYEEYSNVYVDMTRFLNVAPFDASIEDLEWEVDLPGSMFFLAGIEENGEFTASEPGDYVVTVSDGDLSASINVCVCDTETFEFAPSPEDFTVEKEIVLNVGEYGNVNFKFDGPDNFTYDEYYGISFGSADENIATVNKNGCVYANAAGETMIFTVRNTEDGMKFKITKVIVNGESVIDGPKKGKKVTDKKYTYKVTKAGSTDGKVIGELAITGLKKKSIKTVKVAAVVKTGGVKYKVTSVAKNAFKKNKKIVNVIIGKNVKSIGNNAFSNCNKLRRVVINAKGLAKIGKKAFYGDKKLTKVILKSTKLKKVGKKAFARKGGKKLTFKVVKAKKKAYKKLLKKAKVNKFVVK